MKQTVVEWLVEELRGYDDKGDFIFNGVITSELIEQAKAMHKDEIMNACDRFANSIDFEIEDFEHYYNETYGGNNEQQ
jgi:hypothetical protein